METRAHHVLIGSFAILAFLLGLGFVLWLSKTSADREFSFYDVVFTEAVTGLSKGGLVQYNGIKVGEVTQLKLAPDDPRKVIARVRLDGDTPVKVDFSSLLASANWFSALAMSPRWSAIVEAMLSKCSSVAET